MASRRCAHNLANTCLLAWYGTVACLGPKTHTSRIPIPYARTTPADGATSSAVPDSPPTPFPTPTPNPHPPLRRILDHIPPAYLRTRIDPHLPQPGAPINQHLDACAAHPGARKVHGFETRLVLDEGFELVV